MKRPATIILELRPEPDGPDGLGRDPTYRLRVLLKRMLRLYGWRCVELREAHRPRRQQTAEAGAKAIQIPAPDGAARL